MKRFLVFLASTMLCLCFFRERVPLASSAQSQPVSGLVQIEWIVGETPTGGWTVGDHISLRLKATYPATLQVTLPELPQTWGAFELLEQTLLTPAENEDGTFSATREVQLTVWAPGEHQAPTYAVRYRNADNQLYETIAPPLSITVASVLQPDDTEKRDLKPQASLPRPPIWPWILGALTLIAAAGVGGWAALRRMRRRAVSLSTPPTLVDTRPPHEIAYGELDRIAALGLPTKGELKSHYTLVTDCMRNYVQGRYHIPALDQTTSELMTAFHRTRVDRDHIGLFRNLLAEADLVKFAKFSPSIAQANAAVDQARHILNITKVADLETREADVPQARITHPATYHPERSGGRDP